MENPYQTPQDLSPIAPSLPATGSAEEIRRAHIKHEASIKSIGILYYLGAIAAILISAPIAARFWTMPSGGDADVSAKAAVLGEFLVAIAIPLVLSILYIIAGRAIRRLKPWGRIFGSVLSVIGLLAFPVGTLINGYILYLLLSKKGRFIFSPEYKEIIAATPHVKYKTSKAVWIVVIVLIVLAVVAIGIGVSAGR